MRAVPRLHVVSDDVVLAREAWLDSARAVLETGGTSLALHLRGPSTDGARLYELAQQLLPHAERGGATLVVNDRVDVAVAAGVGAVHLGQRSLPPEVVRTIVGDDCAIGVSCHSATEVDRDSRTADYVFFGNVFGTASHPERVGLGVPALQQAATGPLPVLAIGGVAPGAVGEMLDAGAHGVAVLSGVWDAPDPVVAVSEYISALVSAPGLAGPMNDRGPSD